MPMLIGVPRETAAGERRVAVVPEVAKKYVALGAELRIEAQAGAASSCSDTDYVGAGIAGDAAELYGRAQVLLKVAPPTIEEIAAMRPGTVLIGYLQPYQDVARIKALNERKITSFAVELIPRISRAQSMDAL